ncbi:hypothetical protein KI387_012052 [Taxus chinensis]|uniref:Pentatricopeptide repeat-containing protein n=1 Tax=Taxus chinensis TaxID=29808 RepID=A0AA38CP62_TAXCH|nr:hypothetical protein KI387_012052 [Taxus chinensis]
MAITILNRFLLQIRWISTSTRGKHLPSLATLTALFHLAHDTNINRSHQTVIKTVDIQWPQFLNPTHVTQFLKAQKNPRQALAIFNQAKIQHPKYKHNGLAYTTMITILGSAGPFGLMEDVMEEMRLEACECSDTLFSNVIKFYGRAGMVEEAMKVFQRIRDFNCRSWVESFNELLNLLVENGGLGRVHYLYVNMRKWGVHPDACTFDVLIRALCGCNRSDLALELFHEMKSQNCYPNEVTYRTLMQGLCNDGRLHDGKVDVAIKILIKILKKGATTSKRYSLDQDGFTKRLNELCERGKVQEVRDLLNEVLVKGGNPSAVSHSVMIDNLSDAGRVEEARELLSDMLKRGYRPRAFTYNKLVSGLCREGRSYEATKLLDLLMDKGCLPDVVSYNVLIDGFCKEYKVHKGHEYLEFLLKHGGVPNAITYQTLIDAFCTEGKFYDAAKILDKMLDNGFSPHSTTYSTLIVGLCKQGKLYEANIFLEEMVQGLIPGILLWSSLVITFCKETNIKNSIDQFEIDLKRPGYRFQG